MKALPWILVIGLLAALYAVRGITMARGADMRAAWDSVAVLAPVVEAHRTEAVGADTVLVRVTDTLTVTIERTVALAAVSADSVRAHVDSTGAIYLDSLEAAHERHVAAVVAVSDARLAWGTTWRDYALALEAQNRQQDVALTLAYGMLRSQRRRNLGLKAGVVVLGAAIVYGAVK